MPVAVAVTPPCSAEATVSLYSPYLRETLDADSLRPGSTGQPILRSQPMAVNVAITPRGFREL